MGNINTALHVDSRARLQLHSLKIFNPLPNSKILDVTKFKAFADNKFNIVRMIITLLDRVENTVGKGEN